MILALAQLRPTEIIAGVLFLAAGGVILAKALHRRKAGKSPLALTVAGLGIFSSFALYGIAIFMGLGDNPWSSLARRRCSW